MGRVFSFITILLSTSHLITSASIPQPVSADLIARESTAEALTPAILDPRSWSTLIKRKGGGGGRSSGGSSSSSGGSRSGSSSSGSSGSSSRSSTSGGATRSGSGARPAYGAYYGGGAKVPYTAGGRSPTRGVSPAFLPIAAFAFFPGLWLYGSLYAYPFSTPYYYRNANNQNQTIEITCLCQENSVCGCDDNGNTTYVQQVIGDGTDQPKNSSLVVVLPPLANGTQRAYINGTLPNGTTAADPNAEDVGITSSAVKAIMTNYSGYWLMAATVAATVLAT
jgi:hypothetical protein